MWGGGGGGREVNEKENQGVDKQIEINRNQNNTEHRDEQHRRRRMTNKRAMEHLAPGPCVRSTGEFLRLLQ